MKKKIKKIVLRNILPVVIILSLAFTGIIFPFAATASVAAALAAVTIGLLSGAIMELVTGLFTDFVEDFPVHRLKSMFIDGLITEKTMLGQTFFIVNQEKAFSSEEEKSVAQIVCNALNSLEEVEYYYDGEKLTLTYENYTKLIDLMVNKSLPKTADGALPPIIDEIGSVEGSHGGGGAHRDEIGNIVVKYESSNIVIGGYNFNVRGRQPYVVSEIISKINSANENDNRYCILSFFEIDGIIYTNIQNRKENVVGQIYSSTYFKNECILSKFVYNESSKANTFGTTESSMYRFLNSDILFFEDYIKSTSFMRVVIPRFSSPGYFDYAPFSNKYVNTSTGIVHLANDFEEVDLKFIEIPANFTINNGVYFADILKGEISIDYGIKEIENNKIVTIPKTQTEDLTDKAIKGGLVPQNPDIAIDDTGDITIGGIKTETLIKEIDDAGEADTDTETDNENKLDIDMPVIYDKFPFSLPFDIYNLFTIFAEEPKAPKISIPLSNKATGDYKSGNKWYSSNGKEKMFYIDYSVDIDLEEYSLISIICRSLLFVTFLIGLVIITNKLIGRG